MRLVTTTLSMLALVVVAGVANAQTFRIGVSAPLIGPSASLGGQMRDGAQAAADSSILLGVVDDACTAEGGRKSAEFFVAQKTQIVVGFLCTEAIEAALPILKDAGIPVISPGVRTDSLTDRREKTGWPVFRLGPRADSESAAVAGILTKLWRDELFAIIDDGTIYGRELAEGFRAAAEQAGLKPVYVDTFRPQMDNQVGLVGRLRKSGATHVFVGGDRDDIAVMSRDAAGLEAGLVFAGGEALRAAPNDVALAEGTLMIALPEWADGANPRILEAISPRAVPEGYVLPAYAAVQVARVALAIHEAQPETPIGSVLTGRDFETVLGRVRFDGKGDLSENPYRVFRFDGQRFVPLETQ